MKIVVVDGYTLNPGDLSWMGLERLGNVVVHDHTPYERASIVDCVGDAEIAITNKVPFDDATLAELPNLKYIGVTATGYNIVDVASAGKRGIVVTNVPTYGTSSVAQMVFAHVLNITQHVGDHAQTVRDGRWTGSRDFCYWDFPLIELEGLTLGVVGLGRIGRATAELGRAFGMKVVAYDVCDCQPPDGIEMVDLDKLFTQSDVITLHCPLVPETEKLVDSRRLEQMKPTAMLINTSRGPLIDEPALAAALDNDKIAAAGLDVLAQEPPAADNPLFTAKNCYITPHIAWATKSARERLLGTTVDNLAAFLDGKPRNVVS
ncbi:MAG: D-2-hydroxyacid dehydrogenase [Pirellulales bacterium]|nr:D-2-hydroxyacid dehydrogenase [Pirellulales bacterium]